MYRVGESMHLRAVAGAFHMRPLEASREAATGRAGAPFSRRGCPAAGAAALRPTAASSTYTRGQTHPPSCFIGAGCWLQPGAAAVAPRHAGAPSSEPVLRQTSRADPRARSLVSTKQTD